MLVDSSTAMTVEEARSVLWLRNKHRPLGELLDEGYLDERRLAWAAENAYNSRLKEAARVLLREMRGRQAQPANGRDGRNTNLPAIELPISVEEARATLWPIPPYKNRPMGELSDTRQLSLKDLGYAVENAWEKRVRQAAAVLLALRLQQAVDEPGPSAGPLEVVKGGRSYSQERELALTSLQGIFIGAIGVLWLLAMAISIRALIANPPSFRKIVASPVLVVGFVIMVGVTWVIGLGLQRLFELVLNKTDEEIENSRKGQEGEERAVETLRQNLDGEWTLFRNVVIPGKNKADVDAVLVGPPGVWALEVKNYTGEFHNFGEHWERRNDKRAKPLKKSPSSQAKDNAVRLANFLRADGLRQWVEPAVVWANPESPLEVDQPAVPVWTLERLPDELGNLWKGREMEEEHRQAIVEKLTALCEAQGEEFN